MDNDNKIRVIFTEKADDELSQIIRKHNLDEALVIVKIDYISKALALEKVSEKETSDYLQKELNIPSQTAEQISKEIITKIIPFLEKAPEEKFKDPAFVEEISKKVFGTTDEVKKNIDISPKFKPPININEIIEEEPNTKKIPPSPSKRIKKPITLEEVKETAPQIKQSKGPDNYRESIE
jgi:hypothetical protein